LLAAAAFVSVWWPAHAHALDPPTVYDNFQNYPLGSRAAGMGGAYTALACDEAALHYNPAALGCANASRLELAANAYLIQAYSVPDAFGERNDIDAINFHSLPSIAGGVRILSEGEEDGSNRWVFGFNVVVPHSLILKIDPEHPEMPSILTGSIVDNIIALDVGVGWQINRYVAVGASIGGALRTYAAESHFFSTTSQRVPCGTGLTCGSFYLQTADQEALALGLRGKAGVRITPVDGLSLGLAVVSPSIDVFGTSELTGNVSYGLPDATGALIHDAVPFRYEGSSNLSMPLRLAFGIAYHAHPVTVSLDASLNFPHTVETVHELEQIIVEGFPELSQDIVDAAETVHERTWQPNVNLGAEFAIAEPVVLDVGAFTDLSSVSDDAVDEGQDRVHMFGGTLALGFPGRRARGWFGVSFEMGRASAKVIPGGIDLATLAQNGFAFTAESTITRWTLAGFIGSNYSFYEGDNEDPPPPKPKR
jgi:hypothetical protein